jgi:uncharacterized protein (UPF0548 family)
VLSLSAGLHAAVPQGFVRDFSRIVLGRGDNVFDAARAAMQNWVGFDLGWVHVADRGVPLRNGQIVAVIAHTAGLWSVNLSRIVETIDTPEQFGFLYATTPMHVERGEERFLIERDAVSGEVSYTIEAISRPRSILAHFGYPFARAMQRRFARESLARMEDAVQLPNARR